MTLFAIATLPPPQIQPKIVTRKMVKRRLMFGLRLHEASRTGEKNRRKQTQARAFPFSRSVWPFFFISIHVYISPPRTSLSGQYSLPLGAGGNFSEIFTCFQCTEQESGSLSGLRCQLAPSVRKTRLRRNRGADPRSGDACFAYGTRTTPLPEGSRYAFVGVRVRVSVRVKR